MEKRTLLKSFFSRIFYGAIFFMLIASVKSSGQLKSIMVDCPTSYKLSDADEVNYYAGFVNETSQYIAFKAFSSHGDKLVSLVKNDNHYVLSISLPPIPNSTIFKEIDQELRILKYKNI